MTAMFKAELLKLRRRRFLAAIGAAAVAFAAISTIAVFLSASSTAGGQPSRISTASLSEASGIAEAFSTGSAFLGIIVLVLFIANVAGEFSQGTFRTLLMREPRRFALLAGKLAAMLLLVAAVLLAVELLVIGLSLIVAPTQDVSTSQWLTLDGLGEAAGAYGTAVVTVAAWGSFGVALAVLLRSTPIALGVGVAWSGPLEHLISDMWTGAFQWFPGLLLEAVAVGGTDDVEFTRALLLTVIYVVAAVGAATLTFARRDITT